MFTTNIRQRMLPVMLFSFFVLLMAGPVAAAQSPEEVTDAFWKALWSGKYEDAWQYFSAAKKSEATAGMFAEIMRGSLGDSGVSKAIQIALESVWVGESAPGTAEAKVKEMLVREFLDFMTFKCETISTEGDKAVVHIFLFGPDFDNLPAGEESKIDQRITELQAELEGNKMTENEIRKEIKTMVNRLAKSKQDKLSTIYLVKENDSWLINDME